MKITEFLIKKIKSKALQSTCRFKVAGFAFSRKGNLLASVTNSHRFSKKGGGHHAELLLIKKFGYKIKTIVICRVGNSGNLLPIDPCSTCKKEANKLNIKILTVK